jgi:2-polyprenyl-6-methoxyphenol hydroxylase-like FAD-dependent oxidoreductase
MSSRPAIESDVIIVGGGPVGTALAIDLHQRGVRCQVIERHPTLQNIPKGQNLTQRTMEYLARLGAEDEVRSGRTITAAAGVGGMTVYGTLDSGIKYDWLVRSSLSRFYHRASERLPQPATERGLRNRLRQLGVHASYGWTAEVVESTADYVRVRSTSSDAEEVIESKAKYVVGCDGAASRTRESVGISQTRVDHDKRMALLVFRSMQIEDVVAETPDRQFFAVIHPRHHGYWQFIGRVDADSRWFFHAPVTAGATAETLDVPALVAEAVGRPVELEVEHVGFWDLRFAIANTYRAGRVFVAGDAAHSHPPYGGYGINTGFEDAANLAWKLAIALQTGKDAILDSYDEERRPVFASTAKDFIDRSIRDDREFLDRFRLQDRARFDDEWKRRAQFAAGKEVGTYAPHYSGSSRIIGGVGETSASGDHQVIARPGHRLAPWRAGDQTMLDTLSTGFTLLTTEPECAGAFQVEGERLGVPVAIVPLAATAATVYNSTRVLVRPDLYVAAVANEDGSLVGSLRMASGQ